MSAANAGANDEERASRLLLCDLGRRLYDARLIAGRAGNLSLRLETGWALVSPRGVHKGRLEPEHPIRISLTDPDPRALARVTTEWPLHRGALLGGAHVGAVLHAHAPALTAAGLRRLELADHLPELEEAVGRIVRVPFTPSASEALGRVVGEAVRTGVSIVLMEAHGVVAVGRTGEEALNRLELAELGARAVMMAVGSGVSPR